MIFEAGFCAALLVEPVVKVLVGEILQRLGNLALSAEPLGAGVALGSQCAPSKLGD